jgi:alcohol-forming fatty acyl-CoA reductase
MASTLQVGPALAGKRVLITGTTGFIGKVFLEKLVRAVPDIAGITLLLRGNRAHPTAEARFRAEVLSSSVFDTLRRTAPERLHEAVSRMRFVTGEITEPSLGLSPGDFRDLAREIDVIVNVAASVNFREELDRALSINALALRDLTRLARMGAGTALVQVSTCYVNGHQRGLIAEEISSPSRIDLPRAPQGHHEVDPLIASLQAKVAEIKLRITDPARQSRALVDLGIRESQRHGWNDTYTFTKWIGEQIACREMSGGTLTIVRPAIVESACREPQPGWIEGMKVGDAIVLAYARGKTTLFPARLEGVVDIIPVDLVANTLVLATAQALARPGQRRIVQAGTSTRNPVRVGQYIDLCQTEMRTNQAAYPKLIRRPITRPFRTVPRAAFVGYLAVAHGVAKVANTASRWLGARQNLALFDKLETTRELAVTFSFYTSPRYVFDNSRLLAMAAEFDFADRAKFEVDPLCFEWAQYVAQVHLPGLEKFAVKDREATPVVESAPAMVGVQLR